jgi:hypothetical protein
MPAAISDIAMLQKGRPATTEKKEEKKKDLVKDGCVDSVHPSREESLKR